MDIKAAFATCLAVYILILVDTVLIDLHSTITLHFTSLVSCIAIVLNILLTAEPMHTALWETLRLLLQLWLWKLIVDIKRSNYSWFCFVESECIV